MNSPILGTQFQECSQMVIDAQERSEFSIPPFYAAAFTSRLLELRKLVEKELPSTEPNLIDRERERGWAEEPVIVGKWEPSEEPWASLLLGTNDSP